MIRRILLGVAVGVVLFTVGVIGLGWKPYVVMSESMAPALHTGDLILVDPGATSVAVYEIVTYTDPRGLVTHRIVGQAEDGTLTLKGDANQQADTRPVERRQLIGPVRLILPDVGWPVVQVRTHPIKVAGGALILALVWPRRRMLRIIVLGGLVAVVAMVPTTGAAFTANTGNAGNTVATRSRFYPVAVTDLNPICYWRLGDGTDQMGVAPLTFTSSTLGVPGAIAHDGNTALRLTSASSRGSTAAGPAALNLTTGFTTMAWVKSSVSPQGSNARVIAKYDGTNVNYLLAWDTAGTAMRVVVDTTTTRYTAVSALPNNGAWHLAAGTWDGTTLKLYLDGTLANSVATTGTAKTNTSAVTVGYTTQSFVGDVDEAAIWDHALTAARISDLYTLGTT